MNLKNIRTIIIDDDEAWHGILETLVKAHPRLECLGSFSSPLEAQKILTVENVDLILLDVEMPNNNGIEFVERMNKPPMVIYVSAYPEYAAKSYEVNAVDYLVKPFSTPRFMQAIEKALLKNKKEQPITDEAFFFIRENNQYVKIEVNKVLFLKSMENYTQIVTTENSYMALMSFSTVEEQLPPSVFKRVHRSYIVNISKINTVTKTELTVGDYLIPLTRTFVDSVMDVVVKKRLITKL